MLIFLIALTRPKCHIWNIVPIQNFSTWHSNIAQYTPIDFSRWNLLRSNSNVVGKLRIRNTVLPSALPPILQIAVIGQHFISSVLTLTPCSGWIRIGVLRFRGLLCLFICSFFLMVFLLGFLSTTMRAPLFGKWWVHPRTRYEVSKFNNLLTDETQFF